jgi:hypothetical protein
VKTQPTEIDREAARLFTAAPGMHVAYSLRGSVEWGRCIMTEAGMKLCSEYWTAHTVVGAPIVAIDTDDPAAVGVMLAQVEAEAQASVELWHCPDDPPGESGVVFIRARDFASYPGPTRGAALVAAMRSIKSKARGE